jgi:aspartate aminotransferase-like enzyme
MQLRIPGPTPCPPESLQAQGKQMINHRGEEFSSLLNSITDKMKKVFQTKEDVLLLTCSGTGGLEAAIVNTLSPGDKVLSTSVGVFGDRFAEIASQYGANVVRLGGEWGKPVDLEALKKALKADKSITAILTTHNETSTGITNDIKEISTLAREFDKLLLVDSVSGLSCIDLPVDEWQCDVVISASQKGWMVPPGLAMVSVNEKAWQAYAKAKMPRYYMDFGKAKDYLEKGQNPWTPAISLCFSLDATLDLILEEGLKNVFARHARVAQIARDGIKTLGLPLFAQEDHASNTVTAVKPPDNIDVTGLVKLLKEEYDVILAGGQKNLSGKIFRIGHLGMVYEKDIEEVIEALDKALSKVKS